LRRSAQGGAQRLRVRAAQTERCSRQQGSEGARPVAGGANL